MKNVKSDAFGDVAGESVLELHLFQIERPLYIIPKDHCVFCLRGRSLLQHFILFLKHQYA